MAPKLKKSVTSRRFTNKETLLFSEVLADTDNQFLLTLEKLALKKASNDGVLRSVKKIFDGKLAEPDFVKENEKENFTMKNGTITKYDKLDTSTDRLRTKIKYLKQEWRKITDRVKQGSGLAPVDEPGWYEVLNIVFAETNSEIMLVSNADETSFCNPNETEADDEDDDDSEVDLNINKGASTSKRTSLSAAAESNTSEEESGSDDQRGEQANNEKDKPVKKLVVSAHRKRNQVRSKKQALTELSSGMKALAESQVKRHKMSLEEDRRREERREEIRREERKEDREHELQIARIYAEAFARSQSRPVERPTNSVYPSSSPQSTFENSFNTPMFSPTGVPNPPQSRRIYNPMDSPQGYSPGSFYTQQK